MLLPRYTYLPTLVERALDHFRHVLPPEVKDAVNTPWFEDDGLPLRWQLPAGVLFDLLHKGEPGIGWHVTIHFRDFPSDTLPVWEGDQPLLQAFLNSLKEAAVICAGSAAAVLQMSQQSQQNLWSSVQAADLTAYQRVASSLHLTPKARGARSANVPVRLHFRNTSGDYMSSYEGIAYTSRPIGAGSGGQEQTLLQTLQHILPQCFMLESGPTQSSGQSAESPPAVVDTPSVATGSDMQSIGLTFLHGHRVLIAGIQPSLQTSLMSLHAALHAADMFLYVTVIVH